MGYSYDPHNGHFMENLPDNSGFITVSLCVMLCMLIVTSCHVPIISGLSVVIFVIANSGLQALECPVAFV